MLRPKEWQLSDNTSPGYVGKHRNELWAERDAKYGKGNWQTIWLVGRLPRIRGSLPSL